MGVIFFDFNLKIGQSDLKRMFRFTLCDPPPEIDVQEIKDIFEYSYRIPFEPYGKCRVREDGVFISFDMKLSLSQCNCLGGEKGISEKINLSRQSVILSSEQFYAQQNLKLCINEK